MSNKPAAEAAHEGAGAAGGDHLTFTFILPHGPKTSAVFVLGGADADADDKIETGEVAAFQASGHHTWTREQDIEGQTAGKLVSIAYSVGSGVLVRIAITNRAGAVVFRHEETTVFAHQTLGGRLS